MIPGEHTTIRFPEPDDALFLRQLYVAGPRRAALLDVRREPLLPTTGDIREMLARKDAVQGLMYTVEDAAGALCGWCGLRGINYEAQFAELVLLFADDGHYDTAVADEPLDFLLDRAFINLRLRKVVTLCLETEAGLGRCLERRDFRSAGVQRDAFYGGGAWHDINTYVGTVSALTVRDAASASGVANP